MGKRLSALVSSIVAFAMVCCFAAPACAEDGGYWWVQYVQAPMEDWSIDGMDENGAVHSGNNYALFTSDLHRYTYLSKDLLTVANNLVALDGRQGNVGLFAFGGDFANEYVMYDDNMSIIKAALQTSPGTVATYTKGNHEGAVTDEDFQAATGMSRVGETCINDSGDYYFYNFGASTSTQEFLQEDIDELAAYLQEHNDGKPVFICSHYPLHYYSSRRKTKLASNVVELLNNYPQAVFLWGHNHTESDPTYGCVRTAGDLIQLSASEDSSVEINFTYASLGALRDGTCGANGVLVRVDPDAVVFRYINLYNAVSSSTWTDAQGNKNKVRTVTISRTPEKNLDGSAVSVDPTPDLSDIRLANVKVDSPVDFGDLAEKPDEFSPRFTAGKIAWTDENGGAITGFTRRYLASFTLTAEDGYRFDQQAVVKVNEDYAGPAHFPDESEANVLVSADGKSARVSCSFEAPDKVETPKIENVISAADKTLLASAKARSFNLNATQTGNAVLTYSSSNGAVSVDAKGKVTVAKNFSGQAEIVISAQETDTYQLAEKTVTITVSKRAQTMKVSPVSKAYKVAKVKAKARSFSIKVAKAKGAVSYASKSKYVAVTAKGKVTVKKGTPKGAYKVVATAKGNSVYKSGKKTVTVKVK